MRRHPVGYDIEYLSNLVLERIERRRKSGLALIPGDLQLAVKANRLRHEREMRGYDIPETPRPFAEVLGDVDDGNIAPLSGDPELVAKLRQLDVVDRQFMLQASESLDRLIEILSELSESQRLEVLASIDPRAEAEYYGA